MLIALRAGGSLRPPRRRPATVLGLSTLLAACATIQEPPGGPPDFTPPALTSVTPDSGAILPEFKDAAVFRFNEVIAERPGVALDQLFVVSPRPRQLELSWRRDAVQVRPREGWRRGVVYQLILLPGITDLRNNRSATGRSVVFSTGGPIPATALSGRVVDWENGRAAPRALIEATHLTDSLVYWGVADSTGTYTLTALSPGTYVLSAAIDRSGNRRREYREPFDSAVITLDSTAERTFWAFTHDSIGPRIRTVARVDSLTLQIEFNQMLRPGAAGGDLITVTALPDSLAVAVAEILTRAAYDSAQARRKPAAGAPDTTSAGVPPAAEDTAAPRRAPPSPLTPSPAPPGPPPGDRAPVDSALIRLLGERPKLSPTLVARVETPLRAGGRYLVRARAPNVSGAVGESSFVLVLPAARDSARTGAAAPAPERPPP